VSSPLTPPPCVECGKTLLRVEHRASEYLRYGGPSGQDVASYDSVDASEGMAGETTLRCMECGAALDRAGAAFFYENWAVLRRIREANERGIS
jgi:phage FluMu protein Com